jgi:hypothetical protein
MHAFILQDWTTIRAGGSSTVTITQQETDWLDLAPYQDVVFWIDIKDSTNTPTIFMQTSPTLDDSLFQAIISGGTPMAPSGVPAVIPALMASASTSIPLARYLRWQIVGTATWDATFRIAIAANSPGM